MPEFEDAAQERFEAEHKELLARLTEEAKSAKRAKASVNWNRVEQSWQEFYQAAAPGAWRSTFVPLMQGVVKEQGNAWNAEFGIQFDVQNLFSLQWFDDYTLVFADQVTDTTSKDLSAMLAQAHLEGWSIPDMEKRLGTLFDQYIKGNKSPSDFDWFKERMPAHRREMIARTETMRASNAGSFELFKGWGTQKKEWLATGDDRTRPTHLQAWSNYFGPGKAIPINEPFLVGGSRLMFPGDPAADPKETIRCRCAILPVVGKPEVPKEELGQFTSDASAVRWMSENYPHIKSGFRDMHMGGVNEAVKEFDRLAKKYPEVAKRIKVFGTDTGTGIKNPYQPGEVVAYASKQTGEIIFDAGAMRDWAGYRDPLRKQTPGFGEWLVQDTNHYKLTTAHEFGHHVDYWLESVDTYGKSKTFLPILGMDGTGMVNSSWKNWMVYNKPKARGLSRYSTTNDRENIAESFAAMETVPKAKWTQHVKRFDRAGNLIMETDHWADVPYNDQLYVSDLRGADRQRAGELVSKWRRVIEGELDAPMPIQADWQELFDIAARHWASQQ